MSAYSSRSWIRKRDTQGAAIDLLAPRVSANDADVLNAYGVALADAVAQFQLEAVLTGIYLDRGFEPARQLIEFSSRSVQRSVSWLRLLPCPQRPPQSHPR